jgi:hypothetical protein
LRQWISDHFSAAYLVSHQSTAIAFASLCVFVVNRRLVITIADFDMMQVHNHLSRVLAQGTKKSPAKPGSLASDLPINR